MDCKLFLWNSHSFRYPAEIFEPVIIRLVVFLLLEVQLAEHVEADIVAACDSDIVNVIEAQAELRDYCRIALGLDFPFHNKWLERIDGSANPVHIRSPSRNNR